MRGKPRRTAATFASAWVALRPIAGVSSESVGQKEIEVSRRTRVFAFAMSALVLTAFTLKEPEFEIEIPNGWEVGAKDADGLITVKPGGGPGDGTNCNVYFVDRPQIKDAQAALNKEYAAPLTDAGWHDFLSTKPEDASISNKAAIDIGGKILQIATLEMSAQGVKARIGFIVTPGRVFDAGCYTHKATFDAHKTTFDKLVRSLKPK